MAGDRNFQAIANEDGQGTWSLWEGSECIADRMKRQHAEVVAEVLNAASPDDPIWDGWDA